MRPPLSNSSEFTLLLVTILLHMLIPKSRILILFRLKSA